MLTANRLEAHAPPPLNMQQKLAKPEKPPLKSKKAEVTRDPSSV